MVKPLLFPKELYEEEVKNKYISRKAHPEYPHIVILNYTPLTVYEKHWNEVTMTCRGLIVNEKSEEILAKPFPKFFNLGEYSEYEKDISFSIKPEVTTKYDGSLGISYKINGKTYWATRGSFTSEESKVAQRIWDEKYSHVHIPDEITLLVEIIDPKTRIVVDYSGMSDLVIIGAMNRFTGEDYSYKQLKNLGKKLGMKVTEQVNLTIDEALKLKSKISSKEEGWVLKWPNGKRLKIKGEEYLTVHKLLYGLSDKQKVEHWKNGNIKDLIMKLPEEFRGEIEAFALNLDKELKNLKTDLKVKIEEAKENSINRKEYALYVKKHVPESIQYLMFKFYDRPVDEQELKEFIYRNYIKFIKQV